MILSASDVFLLGDRPLDDTFRILAEAGYSGVELLSPARVEGGMSDTAISKLRAGLSRWELEPVALSGGWPLASPDPEERKRAVDDVAGLARIAERLGCTRITSELNGGTTVREAESRRAARTSLAELAERLDGSAVTLSVEPHPGDVIERHDEGIALIREVAAPHVKYLYCLPHTFVLGDDAAAMIRDAAEHLGFVHVADSNRQDKIVVGYRVKGYANALTQPEFEGVLSAHEHLVPGRGDLDMTAIANALRDVGYDGVISCVSFGLRDVEDVRRTHEALESLAALIGS
jgi:myo-inositol catabolism protein IolH